MKEYDLLIIGSGVSGLYAWKLAKINELSTIIIESSLSFGGQVTEYYPKKIIHNLPFIDNICANELIQNMYNQAKKINNTDVFFNTTISSIEEIKKDSSSEKIFSVTLSNKEKFKFKKILICSGLGKLQPVRFIDQDISNISYSIKQFEDFKNKKVIVLGGGDSALDFSIELTKYTNDISLIHRRDEFRASTARVNEAAEKGVKIFKNYIVTNKEIKNNKLLNITIKHNIDNSIVNLSLDELIVSYGMNITNNQLPNISINRTELNKYIVDSEQRTSNKNIYAVGDCCEYTGKIKNIIASQAETNKAILNIEKSIRDKKIAKGW